MNIIQLLLYSILINIVLSELILPLPTSNTIPAIIQLETFQLSNNNNNNEWYNIKIPCTIIAGLLQAGIYNNIGSFRYFHFDITSLLLINPGAINELLIEIYRPHDKAVPPNHDVDLAISFVDWTPDPPDSSMGIWRSVELIRVPGKMYCI